MTIPAPEQGMHFEFWCETCKETYIGEDGNDSEHGVCGMKECELMGWWKMPRIRIRKKARKPRHY